MKIKNKNHYILFLYETVILKNTHLEGGSPYIKKKINLFQIKWYLVLFSSLI